MSFADAVRTSLSKYAYFPGRARRSEYWWFVLFFCLVSLGTNLLDTMLGTQVIQLVAVAALLVPAWAVAVRRLHDTGRSGWWVLFPLVPFLGSLVLLVFFVQDSEQGANRYGPSPKYDLGYEPAGYGPAVR